MSPVAVNRHTRKVRMSLEKAVRFHLLYELVFVRNEFLIDTDLTLLTLLALSGETELPAFCERHQHLGGKQNVRNRLTKLTKRKLVSKRRPGDVYLIQLPAELQIDTTQSLLLEYNLLGHVPA